MEHVVLVNERNEVLGLSDKSTVHAEVTPLHRAFSIFLFDNQDTLLLQKRSGYKTAWPLTWSNSCCGHPQINETNLAAAKRRCLFELGLTVYDVTEISPYRYCFVRDGIMENEICPILVGRYNAQPLINPAEVSEIRNMPWEHWVHEVMTQPNSYSPWCVEETLILHSSFAFQQWFKSENVSSLG